MNAKDFFGGLAVLTLGVGLAGAQEATPVAPPPAAPPGPAARKAAAPPPASPGVAGLATGPATVAPHWSKNNYPAEVPEGAAYYIVVRNDTLWDIAKRFLGSPYLWPQVWDQNKYIADAHWIYPGDPVILPKVAVVADSAGGKGSGSEGMPEESGEGALDGEGAEGARAGAGTEVRLAALTEEITLQCAEYIANAADDTSFKVITSEEGQAKIAFAVRDILYLNRGSSAGVKAGDRFMVHREGRAVLHPTTRQRLGVKVFSPGWVQVVLVRENVSVAVVEEACSYVQAGDYLLPFERVSVPLVTPQPPATRLTPPSGKALRHIVDIADEAISAGTGQMVHIDAGSRDGVTPGSLFVAFRIVEPGVPTPRTVVGELAVVAVREATSVAKVIYATDSLSVGEEIELK